MTVTCPSGNQNGARCSFSCKNGSELIGQNVTTCEMSNNRQYADWDFKGGHPPYCEGRNTRYVKYKDVFCCKYSMCIFLWNMVKLKHI